MAAFRVNRAVITAVGRRNLASVANAFSSGYSVTIPETSNLYDFCSKKWDSQPNKTALVDGVTGRSVTYGDLVYRVGCAAKGLAARGVKAGSVVNIHAPNMVEYPILVQAIASLGAIATTSNPLYTTHELNLQLRDSNAEFSVTIPPFAPGVKEAAKDTNVKDIFVIGEASGQFLLEHDNTTKANPVAVNVKEQIVILPYSSGTTGLPKGVMLTHNNLVSNVQQITSHPTHNADFNSNDVVLGVLPMYHIYGLMMVPISSLAMGATVVTLPKFDPPVFLETLQKHKVTFAPLVPPIINFLARHPIVDKFDLSSLRVIFSGAAALDGTTQTLVQQRLKTVTCRQGYGMTELSPVSHIPRVDKVIPGSIGVTVPNCESKIVHLETNEALPAGKENVGELCVRGPNVMLGYLNNQKATDSTIIDGWLHTGDIGWRDAEGNVFLVDRLKELIKTKGFQVAPAELEGLLLQHPGIADCAVVGKPDEKLGEVPVAFVVRKSEDPNATTEEDVKAFIADRVAEYKRLHSVVWTDAIPKSAPGKILRRLLKEKL